MGVSLFSGAMCRLNAVKHTKSQAHQMARMDRPAISTGISNLTCVRESMLVINFRKPNVRKNSSQRITKSSKCVHDERPAVVSRNVQIGSNKLVAINIATSTLIRLIALLHKP
jgi:hypothetical protein